MSRRFFYGSFVFLPIISLLIVQFLVPPYRPPLIVGRANVVLFLVNSESGLSNVHAATAQSLLEHHPEVTVHFASFQPIEAKLKRISSYSRAKSPSRPAPEIVFHELPNLTFGRAVLLSGRTIDKVVHRPGIDGIAQVCRDIQVYISPWSGEDHYLIYQRLVEIIDQVDPAIIVLDTVFRPGIDATRERNRQHAFISPNTLYDSFFMEQPYGSMFWKYPMTASGIQFPVPWRKIPENIYLAIRFIYSVLKMPELKTKQAFLKSKGLSDPINFYDMHRPDVPWFTQNLAEASLPVSNVPENVTSLGPMSLFLGEASEQDPDLVSWMARQPTLLINLGGAFIWEEHKATIMASALAHALERTNLQVIWKFRKDNPDQLGDQGFYIFYSDAFLEPLKPFIDADRVKLTEWLAADPTALMKTGHIVASVHHGGAGCYHEAIEAGVPQLVLPQWFDLYNFARLVEYTGVGVWGCPETSPEWTVDCLADALLTVTTGASGLDLRRAAKKLGETARNSPGSPFAAREIARLAATGKAY